jgi:hypothetical protein
MHHVLQIHVAHPPSKFSLSNYPDSSIQSTDRADHRARAIPAASAVSLIMCERAAKGPRPQACSSFTIGQICGIMVTCPPLCHRIGNRRHAARLADELTAGLETTL